MIDPDGMRAVWNGKYGDDSGYNDDVTGEDKSWDDVQGEYGMGDKGKQTEAERYGEIITIKGQKYHKNTGNIFAAIGNKINSLFGGSSTRFVEHESYDPIEERANQEFAINSMGGAGGILLGKGAGLLFRGIGGKAGNNIALGVTEHLDDFAKSVGGSTWKSWGTKNFQSQFLQTINNSANKIHFNLDGISSPWGAVAEGAKGLGVSRATSWELYQLYSNPAALQRTIFYQGGKVVPSPF